jgi:ferric-dicitrate binding protein FerR (iron transport regulator)
MDEEFQRWVFTPDEETEHYWRAYIVANPQQSNTIAEARQFLLVFTLDKDDAWHSRIQSLKKKVNHTIDHGNHFATATSVEPEIVRPDPTHEKKFTLRFWAAIAASIAVVMISGVWIWNTMFTGDEYITDRGHRSIITLADGTKVWLNADSRLKTVGDFSNGATREVFLEGEAYFKVKRDEAKPFIVKTGDINVKVLGTTFNVSAYPEQTHIETTLVEGKVSIEANASNAAPLILFPKQKAIYQRQSRNLELIQEADLEAATEWRRGHLTFDNVELSEMIAALERWFNVDIHVPENQKLSCRFSARLETKTLDEVLELFATSEGITYEVKGKDVYLDGFMCSP